MMTRKSLLLIIQFLILSLSSSISYSNSISTKKIHFVGNAFHIPCKYNEINNSLLFSNFDKNNDNVLTKSEFHTINQHEFSVFDIDKNNFITLEEFNLYRSTTFHVHEKINCLK
ncbi:hypothetical protein H8R01_00840 [Vibrio metschnikovii]|uniref:hypothetical protein n=2 Tax=Vibrio metschnikovii TaxID=28172 RepID=UPI001646BDE3|nr:hypothetical protein [Vibrio metschnikovii]MBC5811880.1 hypothetical protein [Vibrio metschnikovii]